MVLKCISEMTPTNFEYFRVVADNARKNSDELKIHIKFRINSVVACKIFAKIVCKFIVSSV